MWIQKPLWIEGTLVDSTLFSKTNVFCFLFSRSRRVLLLMSIVQTLSPCGFKNPYGLKELSWIRHYFQKKTYFVSCFLEVDVFRCSTMAILMMMFYFWRFHIPHQIPRPKLSRRLYKHWWASTSMWEMLTNTLRVLV